MSLRSVPKQSKTVYRSVTRAKNASPAIPGQLELPTGVGLVGLLVAVAMGGIMIGLAFGGGVQFHKDTFGLGLILMIIGFSNVAYWLLKYAPQVYRRR